MERLRLPELHFKKWHFQKRIMSLSRVIKIIGSYRKCGYKVVLANGCFDILHVGHVRYLNDSKRGNNELLIVAVNGDKSARMLKGKGRPVLNENDRASLVASLKSVDFVVIFNSADVTRILNRLIPDYHSKGTDYTVDTVPEKGVSEKLGIKIRIAGDQKSHSTTNLLKKLYANLA